MERAGPGARVVRRSFWLLVLVALVPVLGASVRVAQAGWVPEGDDAMIARRSMSVLSTRPPLAGQPSTAAKLFDGGAVEGSAAVDASHGGPLEYWVLALPYRALAWSPAGLLLAVALVNATSVVLLVALAARRLGTTGAVAAVVAVLVVAHRLGSVNVARPLNATILVLPLLAGLVATWSVLRGDRVAVVPAVALLSFVVQAHLGALPLAATALVVTLVTFAWQTWRGGGQRRWGLVAAAAATLAAGWVLVLVEQAVNDPGNLVSLWHVARARVPHAGVAFALAAVSRQVRSLPTPGREVFPTADALGAVGGAVDLVAGAVVVLAVLAAAAWAWRRRHAELAALALLTLATLVVAVAALSRGPASVEVGPSYQLSWLVAVTGLVWFTGAAFAGEALRRAVGVARPAGRLRPATLGLAVLVVAALAVTTTGGPVNRPAFERTRALADAIRAELPRGTYKLSASGTWAYLMALDGVSVELLRHGYDIRLVRLGALPDEPQRRDLDVDVPTIVIDSTDGRPAGGRPLAALGPLTDQPPPWNQPILDAVSHPDVRLRVDRDALGALGRGDPCSASVVDATRGPDRAATRRLVARRLSGCDAPTRRRLLDHLQLVGLDGHWLDLLRADLPAPYPPTGLSAWLVPA